MQMDDLIRRLRKDRMLAVIVIDDVDDSLHLAENLIAGGITAIELTLRTKAAIRCIEIIKKRFPDMLIGAGTVIFPEQVKQICDVGADFALAPGTSERIIEKAVGESLPMIPGISSASDIETALAYGVRTLKYFPAEPLGGIEYLKALQNPYSYLGLQFIPLGGINLSNVSHYARFDFILAIGGSWIATPEMIRKRDWTTIRKNAKDATVELERELQPANDKRE